MITEKKKLTCKVCGYRWTPRVSNPLTCSRCKSHKWNGEDWNKQKN